MWDLPRPGLEPVSPALAGRFSTTAPPGKPSCIIFWSFSFFHLLHYIFLGLFSDVEPPGSSLIFLLFFPSIAHLFVCLLSDKCQLYLLNLLLNFKILAIFLYSKCFALLLSFNGYFIFFYFCSIFSFAPCIVSFLSLLWLLSSWRLASNIWWSLPAHIWEWGIKKNVLEWSFSTGRLPSTGIFTGDSLNVCIYRSFFWTALYSPEEYLPPAPGRGGISFLDSVSNT